MNTPKRLIFLGILLGASIQAYAAYDVRAYGAKGDGATLDTPAIQAAIDACHAAGGGTVWIGPGRYLSGGLELKSHVRLYLEEGAVLLGSTRIEDYPVRIPAYRSYTDNYCERSLIYAENAEYISLAGQGIIEGQGASFQGPYKVRPYMIRWVTCHDVVIEDVHLLHGPMWTVHFLACERVRATGVTIQSCVNRNNDGFDIDSCRNVRISDCDINSQDDAIVLKSTSPRPTENVTIANCIVRSESNALKMGTESNGGFKNISISNCAIYDTTLSGIALEVVDGGTMDGIVVSNIAMRNVACPIFVRLGNRARPHTEGAEKPGMGTLRNVLISHIDATTRNPTGCSITGLPGHPAENISLDHIRIRFPGGNHGGKVFDDVPELPENYPEFQMFGILPAYGFYCRHARNLSFDHIELGFEKTDARPTLIAEDVQDLRLSEFQAMAARPQPGLFWFKSVQDVRISNTDAPEFTDTFLRIDGRTSENIELVQNNLHNVEQIVSHGKEFSRTASRIDR